MLPTQVIQRPDMLVVAFDGLLFDTLGHRSAAVAEALHAEGIKADMELVRQIAPARSIAEIVREVLSCGTTPRHAAAATFDETLLDLVVLRAEKALLHVAASSPLLQPKLHDCVRRAAAITRVVVRADSRRRVVDDLLRLTELEPLIAMTLCSDDAAGAPRVEAAGSTLRRSYEQIVRRMAASRNLLGNASGIGVALECDVRARNVAREFGFHAPDDVRSFELPGN